MNTTVQKSKEPENTIQIPIMPQVNANNPEDTSPANITDAYPSTSSRATQQSSQVVPHANNNQQKEHTIGDTTSKSQSKQSALGVTSNSQSEYSIPTSANEWQAGTRTNSHLTADSSNSKQSKCQGSCATADMANNQQSTATSNSGCAASNHSSKQNKRQEIVNIPIDQIVPNPNQPRKSFSEPAILKLADSINQFGIIQPLTVRKTGHLYELVAGERRLRAAKELGWSTVPCIIAILTEEKSAEISIIENLQRENLNIFEQAEAISSLIDLYGLTQEQIAQKLSNSQSFVANKLRLLRLTAAERSIICENGLSERHARALLRVQNENERLNLLRTVVDQQLTVSKTEELIDSTLDKCHKLPKKAQHQYKSAAAFTSAINKVLQAAKSSNLDIKSRKIVSDSFVELTIIIPNEEKVTTN